MKKIIYIPFFFLLTGFQLLKAEENLLKLWYDKPAKDWMTQALPIGNGRLGGMIFGGTAVERIQFNEKIGRASCRERVCL